MTRSPCPLLVRGRRVRGGECTTTARPAPGTLPEVDVDALARLGGRPPQLRALEADGVHRLGLLALAVGVGVREDVAAAHRVDRAALAARVARQPGVPGRVDVPRHDPIAGREARRRRPRAGTAPAAEAGAQHERDQRRVLALGRGRLRMLAQQRRPLLELLAGDDALLDQVALQRGEPALVVAGGEILGRRHPLDAVAGLVDVDEPTGPDRPLHRVDGAAPTPSWKTGSFSSRTTGPNPCMPPMSCGPFMLLASPGQIALDPEPMMRGDGSMLQARRRHSDVAGAFCTASGPCARSLHARGADLTIVARSAACTSCSPEPRQKMPRIAWRSADSLGSYQAGSRLVSMRPSCSWHLVVRRQRRQVVVQVVHPRDRTIEHRIH